MRYEITILGVVQGVGYRPFVAALAEQLHIKGSVCNSGGVVRIDAFGDAEAMDNFICRLRSYAPPAARVDRVQAERAEKEEPCRQGSYHHEEICHVPFLQKRVCTDGKPAPPCTDHILS